MSDVHPERERVELLADEFASRLRRGESPSVCEYTTAYPEHSARIEELFPVVAMLERLRLATLAECAAVRPCESRGPTRPARDVAP